jgi:hypothetical protein
MSGTSAAWAQFWAAVLPALAVFIVALLTVGTATVRNWVAIGHLQKRADEQGSGGAPPTSTTVVAVPASPASGSSTVPLPAPAYNQLNDPLPDAQQDPFATTDCGEECVSEAIVACGGPSLAAGQLRVLLGGLGRRGSTTAADLVYLLGLFKLPAHPRQANPHDAWIEWQHSYNAKYLCIALGYWVSLGYPHWVLIRETTDGQMTFNDPWGGQVRVLPIAQAKELYMGVYVHIDTPITTAAPGPPSD